MDKKDYQLTYSKSFMERWDKVTLNFFFVAMDNKML